jgi:hypothetical protein
VASESTDSDRACASPSRLNTGHCYQLCSKGSFATRAAEPLVDSLVNPARTLTRLAEDHRVARATIARDPRLGPASTLRAPARLGRMQVPPSGRSATFLTRRGKEASPKGRTVTWIVARMSYDSCDSPNSPARPGGSPSGGTLSGAEGYYKNSPARHPAIIENRRANRDNRRRFGPLAQGGASGCSRWSRLRSGEASPFFERTACTRIAGFPGPGRHTST